MSGLAVLCSGQGFQGPGMFDLVADAPEAQPVFAAARARLDDHDPRDVVAQASDDVIHANANAQLLCCTQALAVWAVLAPRVEAPVVVAGYSVGEVAAWGVTDTMDAATVLDLVAERGRLMDAGLSEPAGMAAVSGLARARVGRIASEAGVFVAIDNGADRVVLAGPRADLRRAVEAAVAAGADRTTALPITVPSHTPLMAAAAERFAAFVSERTDVRAPSVRLLSGIDGASVFSVVEGLGKLAQQVAQTVEWGACMASCRSAGARRSLELGPGSALSKMMGEELGQQAARSVTDFRTIDGVARWVKQDLSS